MPEKFQGGREATVVMLPGLLCDGAVWAPQVQALAGPGMQCVVPDYGLTDSLAQMARSVLDGVAAGPLWVVGHSMGGRVALEIARMAPGRVAGLALLDTGFQARPRDAAGDAEASSRLALLQLARERGMRAMGEQWARGMVHPAVLGTPLFDEILAMIERKSPAIFEAQIRALLERPDAQSVLRQLRCPTLVLCGRQDGWSPLARHEEMHAMVQGSRLVVVEDAGHMTTMERPQAVSDALIEWLRA